MENFIYYSELYNIYKCLFTDKQKSILELYYNENLSLSEISDIENVSKSFKSEGASLEVLKDINLELNEGEVTVILGKNGSGKSTLLKIIGGVLTCDSGKIIYNDKQVNTSERKRHVFLEKRIGIIPQNNELIPELSVYENVSLPLKYRGEKRLEMEEKVMEILEFAGLSDIKDKSVSLLSGGEKQRTAIARALVVEPRILVLDEPTSALDVTIQAQIIDLLLKIQQKRQLSYLFISHDMRAVRAVADHIAVMKDGKIIELAPAATLFENPQSDYARQLINASNYQYFKEL